MLAMWGADSPTDSSLSICEKTRHFELTNDIGKVAQISSCLLFSLTVYLSCKAATQVHGTRAGLGCLEPQHDSGGEFVVSSSTAGLLLRTADTTSYETTGKFALDDCQQIYGGAPPTCPDCDVNNHLYMFFL